MKLLSLSIPLNIIGIFGLFPVYAFTGGEIPYEDNLKNGESLVKALQKADVSAAGIIVSVKTRKNSAYLIFR